MRESRGGAVVKREGSEPPLSFKPLTPRRWAHLVKLFGPRGACGGCWCMWWRLPRSLYNAQKGDGNRRALKGIVDGGETAGIIAYRGSAPIGWCSLGPRDHFPALERSWVLARVDDEPVWSLVCFFVEREHRHQGVTSALIAAAVQYARRKGAAILEAYPVEPKGGASPDAFAFTGLASSFLAAGFTEAARRSPKRAVYRLALTPGRRRPGGASASLS